MHLLFNTCNLLIKGEEVAIKACTLKWYRLPNVNARALILIMAISNSPTVIKAGKFVDLSLRTFGNVSDNMLIKNKKKVFIQISHILGH